MADAHEFAALLTFVRGQIGRIGDAIMSGAADIAPYRLGKTSPCPQCDYRPVCRFEPLVNGYRHLAPLRRLDVLGSVAGSAAGGAAAKCEDRGNDGGA